MHTLLSLFTEALTFVVGKRWQGFVLAVVALLLIWLILMATR